MNRPLVAFALVAALGTPRPSAAEESLANPGFEQPPVAVDKDSEQNPDGWQLFSSVTGSEKIGMTSKHSHAGQQAARFVAQGKADSYQGLFQKLPATLGATYSFTAHVRNDGANPLKGKTRGQLSIEWKDASGNEIERSWGPEWTESLPATGWKKVEMTVRPPANASTGHFVVTQFDGKDESGSGAFLVDDVSVKRQQ